MEELGQTDGVAPAPPTDVSFFKKWRPATTRLSSWTTHLRKYWIAPFVCLPALLTTFLTWPSCKEFLTSILEPIPIECFRKLDINNETGEITPVGFKYGRREC